MRMPIPAEVRDKMALEKLDAKTKAIEKERKRIKEKMEKMKQLESKRKTTTYNFFKEPAAPVKRNASNSNRNTLPVVQAQQT